MDEARSRDAPSTDPTSPPAPVRTFDVYLIFTASGAAALIYQVIWARWLGFIFGNTTTSISIVLGSFMLGLALGSWLAGRRLDRVADPMLAYVYMEVGIGAFAVLFPLLTGLTDWIFTATVSADSPPALLLGVKAVLSFALLIVPTTLMGATLPLLTDFFRRSPRHTASWKVGVLYAANTFGAALGTVAASYFLIELIGIRSTTLIAALFNFLVAWVGYRYSRSAELEPLPATEEKVPAARAPTRAGRVAVAVLAASGGTALASEVLWTRALETLVGNSTYAFALILIVYLVGIAAGSWLMSLWVNRSRSLPLWLVGLQLGMGLWTVAAIHLFDSVSLGLGQFSNVEVTIGLMFLNHLKAMSLLFPLALLSGAVFPVATRILDPRSEDAAGVLIARAYAWNTLGAVAGSLVAGFVIAALLDYFTALYLLAALYGLTASVAAVVLVAAERDALGGRIRGLATAAVAAALMVFGLLQVGGESRFVRGFVDSPFEVVYHEPGVHGLTSALRPRGADLAENLLVNGKGMTVKITDTKMMAHLPLFYHPRPEKALIICFGMGTTYRSAISHGVDATVVELVSEVYEAFDYFFADAEQIRAYPRGKMVVNDGRNFLKLTEERFDVITIDPPPPIDAAGVNNLYSRDFLELARSRLAAGGIMAHWIPYPGRQAGVDDWETFNMLLATFLEVFPHSVQLAGVNRVGVHLLGAEEPIEVTRELIEERLARTPIAEDLREWDEVPLDYFLSFERLGPWTEVRKPSGELVSLVTDDRPRLEFHLLRSWREGVKKTHPSVNWHVSTQKVAAPFEVPEDGAEPPSEDGSSDGSALPDEPSP